MEKSIKSQEILIVLNNFKIITNTILKLHDKDMINPTYENLLVHSLNLFTNICKETNIKMIQPQTLKPCYINKDYILLNDNYDVKPITYETFDLDIMDDDNNIYDNLLIDKLTVKKETTIDLDIWKKKYISYDIHNLKHNKIQNDYAKFYNTYCYERTL
jgi:hypothetical protein